MEDRMLSDEILLGIINSKSGGGGTTDYSQLSNKPQINSVELSGDKSLSDLGIASATALGTVSNAVTAIKDGTNIDSFGDVETALAGKQGVLTAGDYVSINNNEIKVRTSKGTELHTYKFTSQNGGYGMMIEKYVKGTKVSETTYSNGDVAGQEIDIDGVMTFGYTYAGYLWHYTLLVDSREHLDGQTVSWYYSDPVEYTENFDIAADASKNLVLKEDLDAAISSAYHHAGTKTCAELVAGLLVAANEGNVYNITDSGTTTADFIDGAGQPIKAGDNVGIAKISAGVYKFDLLSGFVDTTNFVQKSQTAGLLKNDGTVDTTIQGDVDSLRSGLIDVTESVGYTGHRNLLKSLTRKAVTGTNGITVAPTFDSLGNVNSIVVNNQTASGSGSTKLASIDYLPAGTYKISGCLVPNANGDKNVFIWDVTASSQVVQCLHSEETFTVVSGHSYLLNLYASVGQTIDTTLYPMIRVASDTDNTYVPYHPVLGEVANDYLNTDVESRIEAVESGLADLQNDVEGAWTELALSDVITISQDVTLSSTPSKVYRRGNRIRLMLNAIDDITIGGSGYTTIGTIKSGYRPAYDQLMGGIVNSSTGATALWTPALYTINFSGNVNLVLGTAGTIGSASKAWSPGTITIEWALN